jgi:hypothetical protein
MPMTLRPWHLLYIAALCLLATFTAVVYARGDAEDTKVGVAMFKLWHQGNALMAQPLLTPIFKVEKMAGEGVEPTTITRCEIHKRVLVVDEKERRVLVVTVLKCGVNEYGISEIEFQGEGK